MSPEDDSCEEAMRLRLENLLERILRRLAEMLYSGGPRPFRRQQSMPQKEDAPLDEPPLTAINAAGEADCSAFSSFHSPMALRRAWFGMSCR